MSYKITIEKREMVTKFEQAWVLLSQEEVERERSFYQERETEPHTRITPKMGYAPPIEQEIEKTTKVYEQTVDYLDFAGVIAVINGLTRVDK